MAAGELIRKTQRSPAPASTAGDPSNPDSAYDLSEFETTDPQQLLYQAEGSFETGFDRVKSVAASPLGFILVAGNRAIRIFNPSGSQQREIPLDRPPHCLHATDSGDILVGFADHFEIFDCHGQAQLRSPRMGPPTFFTSITTNSQAVFLADAGNREVVVCELPSARLIQRFGKKGQPPGAPGFVVPSPYFDLAIHHEQLFIANPGRLRVEQYSLDGQFQGSWGEPGMAINRFCGCCNPVFISFTKTGDLITTEKGLARANLYSASGTFKGAIAGPSQLVDDKRLARRACEDCRLGGAFDAASDDSGRIFILDPFRKTVRVFTPRILPLS